MKYQIGLLKESENFDVFVENGAGDSVGYTNEMYKEAGATIIDKQQDVILKSDLVLSFNKTIKNEYLSRRRSFVGYYNVLNNSANIIPFTHTIADVYSLDLLPFTSDFNDLNLKLKITPILYDAIIESSTDYFIQQNEVFPRNKAALIIESGHTSLENVKKLLKEGYHLTVVGNNTLSQVEFEKIGIEYEKLSHLDLCEPNILSRSNGEKRCLSEIALYLTENVHRFDLIITDFIISGEKTPLLFHPLIYKNIKREAVLYDLSAPNFGNCSELKSEENGFKLFTLTEMLNHQGLNTSKILSEIYSSFLVRFVQEINEQFKNFLEDIKVVENGKIINKSLIREVNEM